MIDTDQTRHRASTCEGRDRRGAVTRRDAVEPLTRIIDQSDGRRDGIAGALVRDRDAGNRRTREHGNAARLNAAASREVGRSRNDDLRRVGVVRTTVGNRDRGADGAADPSLPERRARRRHRRRRSVARTLVGQQRANHATRLIGNTIVGAIGVDVLVAAGHNAAANPLPDSSDRVLDLERGILTGANTDLARDEVWRAKQHHATCGERVEVGRHALQREILTLAAKTGH